MRRAKIVCTLGPATSSAENLRELVRSGMDVARLNLSHGDHADHERDRRAHEGIRSVLLIERAERRRSADRHRGVHDGFGFLAGSTSHGGKPILHLGNLVLVGAQCCAHA